MKLKTFLASISACAIAVSAMAISASAAVTNSNDATGAYVVAVNEVADLAWNGGISGAVVTMTLADGWEATGAGGGIVFQGTDVAWEDGAKEFNISGEGTANPEDKVSSTVSGNTLTCTYDFGGAIFAENAEWAQLVVQSWWGADVTVDDVKYLDLDGKVIGEEAPTTTTAGGNNGGTTTTAAGGTATGDAGIALAVAGLAVAGAAAYVARKKD